MGNTKVVVCVLQGAALSKERYLLDKQGSSRARIFSIWVKLITASTHRFVKHHDPRITNLPLRTRSTARIARTVSNHHAQTVGKVWDPANRILDNFDRPQQPVADLSVAMGKSCGARDQMERFRV